jgi:hypothetical protein
MPTAVKLPKFDDWTPPWGEDDEDIDPAQAAKYIHGLLSDKEKLQTKVDAANAKVTEVTAERDEALKAVTEADAKGADEKLTAATAKVADLETKLKAAQSDALKFSVALDEGLTKVQAKRLIGNTEEELKADAEELVQSFGSTGAKPEDEEGEEEDGVPTRTPRGLRNPVDSGREEDNPPVDIQKAIDSIPRGQF